NLSHERTPRRAGSDGASSRNVPVHVLAEPDRRAGLHTHEQRSFVARGQMRSSRKEAKGREIPGADTSLHEVLRIDRTVSSSSFFIGGMYECTRSSVRRSRHCNGLSYRCLRGATTAALPSESERSRGPRRRCQPWRCREAATAAQESADPTGGSTSHLFAAAGICRGGQAESIVPILPA